MPESALAGTARGSNTSPVASTTYYGAWNGAFVSTAYASNVSEAAVQLKARGAFTAKNMRIRLNSNGRTTACTLTLRKNGADTALSIVVSASTSGIFSDTTNTVPIADGDTWNYSWVNGSGTGSQTVTGATLETVYAGQAATQLAASGQPTSFNATSTTRYLPLAGSNFVLSSEPDAYLRAREAATLSGFQAIVTANQRTSATVLRIRKNGANGNQVISVTALTTGFFEDTTNTDTLAVDDSFNVSITSGTGVNGMTVSSLGAKYTGAAVGRAYLGTVATFTSSTTQAQYICPFSGTGSSSEPAVQVPMPFTGKIRGFAIYATSNGSTGATVARPRINGLDGAQSVSISAGTTGWFQDSTNSDNFVGGDLLAIAVSVSATAAVSFRNVSMLVDGPGAPNLPTWSFIGIQNTAVDDTGDYTLDFPAAAAEGDLLVAAIGYRGTAQFTPPAGWQVVAHETSGNAVDSSVGIASLLVCWCVRGASNPSGVFTRTGGNGAFGSITAYRSSSGGTISVDVVSQNTLATGATTATTPSLTTGSDNQLIVALVGAARQGTANANYSATDPGVASGTAYDVTTAPAVGKWKKRNGNSATLYTGVGYIVGDAIKGAAGATGTIQCAGLTNLGRHAMIAVSFKDTVVPPADNDNILQQTCMMG